MAENNLSELGGSVQLTAGSGGELIISIPAELARRGPRFNLKKGKFNLLVKIDDLSGASQKILSQFFIIDRERRIAESKSPAATNLIMFPVIFRMESGRQRSNCEFLPPGGDEQQSNIGRGER